MYLYIMLRSSHRGVGVPRGCFVERPLETMGKLNLDNCRPAGGARVGRSESRASMVGTTVPN